MSETITSERFPKRVHAEITPDDDPESPREWCNVGRMGVWWGHRRYNLGDKDCQGVEPRDWLLSLLPADHRWREQPTDQDADDAAEASDDDIIAELERLGGIVLPLFIYEHGGITISCGGFSCPWDSGQAGWIVATAEDIAREWRGPDPEGKTPKERARAYLGFEVEAYRQYLEGDVWGVEVYLDDEEVESCWGFFGRKFAEEEARSMMRHYEDECAQEAEEAALCVHTD